MTPGERQKRIDELEAKRAELMAARDRAHDGQWRASLDDSLSTLEQELYLLREVQASAMSRPLWETR